MTTYEDLLAELVSQGLTLSLPSSNISELWTNGPHFDKTRDKELEIEKAVLTGHLKGVPKLRDPNYPTGYRKIPVDDWHHIRDCWFAGSFVSYDITRADFREWLISRGDWPLPETCLLSKWWTTENLEESETKHAIQEDLENTVRLASILHVEEETEKAWENEDYDGVLGLPPDWVSKPVLDQFKDARNRMLEKWKYHPKDAQEWVERYSRAGEENNDWFYPALFPCGNEMEPIGSKN